MNSRILAFSFLVFCLVGFAGSISARADYHSTIASYETSRVETTVDKMSRKFWRGVFNTATGIGELPRQLTLSCRESGALVGIPVGLLNGLIMVPVRTGFGVFETVTFIVPTTPSERAAAKMTYAPLLKPTFVWQSE